MNKSARADNELFCGLPKSITRRNTLCISRGIDDGRSEKNRYMPKPYLFSVYETKNRLSADKHKYTLKICVLPQNYSVPYGRAKRTISFFPVFFPFFIVCAPFPYFFSHFYNNIEISLNCQSLHSYNTVTKSKTALFSVFPYIVCLFGKSPNICRGKIKEIVKTNDCLFP